MEIKSKKKNTVKTAIIIVQEVAKVFGFPQFAKKHKDFEVTVYLKEELNSAVNLVWLGVDGYRWTLAFLFTMPSLVDEFIYAIQKYLLSIF